MNNTYESTASDQKEMETPFRVLSIDGGGIRGLYTAILLQRLSQRFSSVCGDGNSSDKDNHTLFDLGKKFDLIVGTSTGAILSVALVAGIPLEKIIDFYRENGKKIFQKPLPLKKGSDIFYNLKLCISVLSAFLSPLNDSRHLHGYLSEILGNETLAQLYERRGIALCVPSVNAETQRSWVFKTPHSPRLKRDQGYKLVDVCMASTAAPLYFPLHSIENGSDTGDIHKFVDGGLWANNPVMVGLVEALEMAGSRPIEILSVGTIDASPSRTIRDGHCKWGVWKWTGGIDILRMSMEAQTFCIPYMVERISKSLGQVTYYRLTDPKISLEYASHLALDAVGDESIRALTKLAGSSVDENYSRLTNPKEGDTKEKCMVRNIFSRLEKL